MFCRNCGKELAGSPEFCGNCGAKPMAGTSFCPGCGAPTTPMTEICTNCGARVSRAIKGKTWKPTTAGILCIIAGIIGVIPGIAAVFLGAGWLSFIVAPLIIFWIVPIVGGIYALRRRRWGLALAGSICAFIGFVIFVIFGIFIILLFGSDQPEIFPFDATIFELLNIIFSSNWYITGLIVVLGILGILTIIFVIRGKREFK